MWQEVSSVSRGFGKIQRRVLMVLEEANGEKLYLQELACRVFGKEFRKGAASWQRADVGGLTSSEYKSVYRAVRSLWDRELVEVYHLTGFGGSRLRYKQVGLSVD